MNIEYLRERDRQAILAYAEPSHRDVELQTHECMIIIDDKIRPELGIPKWTFDYWKMYYDKNMRMLYNDFKRRQSIAKEVRSMDVDGFPWYFITVGYDDENITVDKIRKFSQAVATSKYFDDVQLVNEKFRKNDQGEIYIHHHTHFLVKCELSKSRVIDRVFATVKKVVKSKNFVDVKGYKDGCGSYAQKLKYINGDKTEHKLECVQKDILWRQENNL